MINTFTSLFFSQSTSSIQQTNVSSISAINIHGSSSQENQVQQSVLETSNKVSFFSGKSFLEKFRYVISASCTCSVVSVFIKHGSTPTNLAMGASSLFSTSTLLFSGSDGSFLRKLKKVNNFFTSNGANNSGDAEIVTESMDHSVDPCVDPYSMSWKKFVINNRMLLLGLLASAASVGICAFIFKEDLEKSNSKSTIVNTKNTTTVHNEHGFNISSSDIVSEFVHLATHCAALWYFLQKITHRRKLAFLNRSNAASQNVNNAGSQNCDNSLVIHNTNVDRDDNNDSKIVSMENGKTLYEIDLTSDGDQFFDAVSSLYETKVST